MEVLRENYSSKTGIFILFLAFLYTKLLLSNNVLLFNQCLSISQSSVISLLKKLSISSFLCIRSLFKYSSNEV